MNTHCLNSASTYLAMSLAIVVAHAACESASAQTQIQPQRIGGPPQSAATSRSGVTGGVNKVAAGRGNALGDGTGMGGQTFSWTRGSGSGQQLGGGNVLDRNSQVGSGGANNLSASVDYNARNLIITDSVPGGRGFRGAVGYTADTDFRGLTGSDSTYAFRAGSAMSNPAFISSAAYQDRFLVAQGLGVFEYRRDSTPIGSDAQRSSDNQPDSRLRLDRANAQMSFGRMNWELGEDRTVAKGTATNGDQLRYIVSPLRGLQAESMADPVVASGLGIYEQARVRKDISNGLMNADELSRVNLGATRVNAQVQGAPIGEDLRVKDARVVPKSYVDLMSELEAKASAKTGQSKGALDRVKEDISKIGQGTGDKPTTDKPTTKPTTKPTDGTAAPIDPSALTVPGSNTEGSALIPGGGVIPDGGAAQREAKSAVDREKPLPIADMATILRHGRTINQLGTEERRRVDELVHQGEEALRHGEYFQAERRFGQAQAIASENPLVEVGVAHAQIGAGLYLSAGLTLRNLFAKHPELIDAKYDATLLPAGERLTQATTLMRTRISRGDDSAGYGLVLSYIGHQTSQRALVEEGLAAISGNESLDTARKLLEGIWLGEK